MCCQLSRKQFLLRPLIMSLPILCKHPLHAACARSLTRASSTTCAHPGLVAVWCCAVWCNQSQRQGLFAAAPLCGHHSVGTTAPNSLSLSVAAALLQLSRGHRCAGGSACGPGGTGLHRQHACSRRGKRSTQQDGQLPPLDGLVDRELQLLLQCHRHASHGCCCTHRRLFSGRLGTVCAQQARLARRLVSCAQVVAPCAQRSAHAAASSAGRGSGSGSPESQRSSCTARGCCCARAAARAPARRPRAGRPCLSRPLRIEGETRRRVLICHHARCPGRLCQWS